MSLSSRSGEINQHPQSGSSRRRTFLDQRAAALGIEWAQTWRQQLRDQGRAAAGAWPGTISEARARVDQFIVPEMARRRMPVATDDERTTAARAVYMSAKNHWNEHRERDDTDY